MIFSVSQIRRLLSDPDMLIELVPSPNEREVLAGMGLRPLLDDLRHAHAAGVALDTAESDVHYAAAKALTEAERAVSAWALDWRTHPRYSSSCPTAAALTMESASKCR
jgi:hypothetical protein